MSLGSIILQGGSWRYEAIWALITIFVTLGFSTNIILLLTDIKQFTIVFNRSKVTYNWNTKEEIQWTKWVLHFFLFMGNSKEVSASFLVAGVAMKKTCTEISSTFFLLFGKTNLVLVILVKLFLFLSSLCHQFPGGGSSVKLSLIYLLEKVRLSTS